MQAGSILRNLRYDLPASLVVFLVALPLPLGIAIASGAPLMAGLIAAVVGGIVAGSVGGSALQVSGRAPRRGVAPVVVHAMLAGIGVTIVLQQIHVLMGGKSRSSAWENIKAVPSGILHHELHEVFVGGIVIAILLLWPKLPAKVRLVPGALVAIVVATIVAEAAGLEGVDRIELSANFFRAISLPHLPPTAPGGEPFAGEIGEIALGVLTVALIASVESLLSAVGIDKLHNGPRTNFDREMIGQGGANAARMWCRDCSAGCRSPASSCAAPPTWRPAPAPGCRRFCTACGSCCSRRCSPNRWNSSPSRRWPAC